MDEQYVDEVVDDDDDDDELILAAPTPISKEELEAAVLKAYESAGLVKTLRTGRVVKDDGQMKDRAYQHVTSRVAATRAEMGAHSLTAGELYAKVFPGAPASDPKQIIAELTPLERAVRNKLQRACWNLTNPNRKGSIQSRLGKEGRSEILIRTKVQRGVDEIIGVFLTNDGKLILEESVAPVVEKLLSAARELRLHNEIVVEPRHAELGGAITKMLDAAKRRVAAELTRATTNGSQPALPAAESIAAE